MQGCRLFPGTDTLNKLKHAPGGGKKKRLHPRGRWVLPLWFCLFLKPVGMLAPGGMFFAPVMLNTFQAFAVAGTFYPLAFAVYCFCQSTTPPLTVWD